MLPHANAPFHSATTSLPLPSSLPHMLDTFSFGNCTIEADFPTSHCLPSLWFWLLIAFFFASIGFSVIGVLKLIQYCRMRQGRPDVYFHEFGLRGRLEAGTSSLQWSDRERWVDLEQRAWLYSPDPEMGAGMQRLPRPSMEHEVSAEEEFPLARPPKWFQKMKGMAAKDSDEDLACKARWNQENFWSHSLRSKHSREKPLRSLSVP